MPVPMSARVEGSGTADGVIAVAEKVVTPLPWVVKYRLAMVGSKPATLVLMMPVPVKLPKMPFVTSVMVESVKVTEEALLANIREELPGTKLA